MILLFAMESEVFFMMRHVIIDQIHWVAHFVYGEEKKEETKGMLVYYEKFIGNDTNSTIRKELNGGFELKIAW